MNRFQKLMLELAKLNKEIRWHIDLLILWGLASRHENYRKSKDELNVRGDRIDAIREVINEVQKELIKELRLYKRQ